jgi:hypothetical protein
MQYCTESAESESPTRHRRRQSRYPLRTLSYVRLDQGNGGIIRDLTESGIAIQAVAPLRENQQLRVSFDLLSPRVRVEAIARVVWADAGGQGGLEFSALPLRTRRALRDWLFTQMLSSAAITGRDSIFHSLEPQLVTSAVPRPAIILPYVPPEAANSPQIQWGLFSISACTFANLVDTLVLLCAILLFSISSLAIMGTMPAWPLATALFITACIIFIAVYRLLFSELVCRATPGKRLAALAAIRPAAEQQLSRFR